MAWVSHTIALALPADQADADLQAMLRSPGDGDSFVYAPSRNGCVVWQLDSICKLSHQGKNLYLLKEACLLRVEEVKHAALQIEALLQEIQLNPTLVVEATKEVHQPNLTLLAQGFEPLPAQLVYPDDAIIKDGWVYNHTEEHVLHLLEESCASQTPCPERDDDGESLAYVFNFLRSHLALLHIAAEAGKVVVYGEMNV